MSDAEDAARWRKMRSYLRVEVERREHWTTVKESESRRTEEKVVEWSWQVDIHPDHSWLFYGNTNDQTMTPKSIDDIIDKMPDVSPAAADSDKEKK